MSLRQNIAQRVDRLQGLQAPEEVFNNPGQRAFILTLVDIIRRALREMVSSTEAAPHLLLTSPSGTVFRVTVSDAGVLTVVNART